MITIRLMGGLGNQMFQRAYGLALEARGRAVMFDRSYLVEGTHRAYSLEAFRSVIPITRHPQGPIISEKSLRFDLDMLHLPDPSIAVGYWQNEKYFLDIENKARQALSFRKPIVARAARLQEEIQNSNSVFIHVRRGDYINFQHVHGVLPMSYYQEAIQHVEASVPGAKIFIFSDDQEWCKKNFKYPVVEGTDKYDDLKLMASCKHAIIANSSFSWWGAWLGDTHPSGRVVIAPKKWFVTDEVDGSDIVPQRWVRL